jgi:hypothetical protein
VDNVVPLAPEPPEPPRPLGREGRRLWDSIWNLRRAWIDRAVDLEHVALLCESMDERMGVRVRAMRDGEWRDRVALRNLDEQIRVLMAALGLNPTDRKALNAGGGAGSDNSNRLAGLRASLPGATRT